MSRSSRTRWKDIPSYAMVAGQDYNIPPKAEQWMADRAHARTVTIDNASHAVAVSHPAAVADLILRAARDTR
ncbi:hypothetical protein GCM10010195_05420 [Kitasatospora griseola]|nr:hypothetical protein GCM10010195_05420 [Kitasatospora griseola]